MFRGRPINYAKLTNLHAIKATHLNEIIRHAQRVCLKNLVVSEISKEVVKSEAKYVTMVGVSNVQNLEHTKFYECEQANLVRCEMLKENIRIFGDKLKALTIRRTYSVDNLVCQSFYEPQGT